MVINASLNNKVAIVLQFMISKQKSGLFQVAFIQDT